MKTTFCKDLMVLTFGFKSLWNYYSLTNYCVNSYTDSISLYMSCVLDAEDWFHTLCSFLTCHVCTVIYVARDTLEDKNINPPFLKLTETQQTFPCSPLRRGRGEWRQSKGPDMFLNMLPIFSKSFLLMILFGTNTV